MHFDFYDALKIAVGIGLGLAVGLAAHPYLRELMACFVLRILRPIREGHLVEVDGYRGRVERVGFLTTRIACADFSHLKIANSKVLEKAIVASTQDDEKVGHAVRVGVAYGSPVEVTMRLLAQAANEAPGVYKEPRPVVIFQDFGESALIFEVSFAVGTPDLVEAQTIVSNVRVAIERLLRRDGIEIALPQQDVHLHAEKGLNVTVKQERGRML